jgi:hypothetical protein
MKLVIMAALALNFLPAAPSVDSGDIERALRNYRAMLAGQRQLGDLTAPERLEILELERWLGSHNGIAPSETKEQCKERLRLQSTTELEEALLDLKCSQRPAS